MRFDGRLFSGKLWAWHSGSKNIAS